jgi:biotin operon repressor
MAHLYADNEKGLMSTKQRLLKILTDNLGSYVPIEQLREAAQTSEWARVIRQLVQEEGYQIELGPKSSRRLLSLELVEHTARDVNAKQRYRILQRDNSICQRCGRTPAQGVQLVIDHKIPSEWGGSNDDENLWTLCTECNGGKKNWFSDQDTDLMREVLKQRSGRARLRKMFELNPNKPIDVSILHAVSGIRDWTRTVRDIRSSSGLNIRYEKAADGSELYIYEP